MTPPFWPDYVIHADWSLHPKKRWATHAEHKGNGRYHISFPRPVKQPIDLIDPLIHSRRLHPNATILLGIDVPIGLPIAYADQIGCDDFLTLLPNLGQGQWSLFYQPAHTAEEISLKRPFYPQKPGGTRQQHLLDALNVPHMNALRRRCELPTPYRRAAAPLFWTMGAQQVGKAAITVWRDVLQPSLANERHTVAIWPFAGRLKDLLSHHRIVVAEAYPSEFYHHLGIKFPPQKGRKYGKRIQADRKANAPQLMAWAADNQLSIDTAFQYTIADGFGKFPYGEDWFDATVGVMGMLNILFGKWPIGEPSDSKIRQIEGSILGILDSPTLRTK